MFILKNPPSLQRRTQTGKQGARGPLWAMSGARKDKLALWRAWATPGMRGAWDAAGDGGLATRAARTARLAAGGWVWLVCEARVPWHGESTRAARPSIKAAMRRSP